MYRVSNSTVTDPGPNSRPDVTLEIKVFGHIRERAKFTLAKALSSQRNVGKLPDESAVCLSPRDKLRNA